ncbi:hypothetical protein Ddc_02212 [Ditylenchus destructor]|nr:hypothetical protein Ddc_02212 [Ditylenchus destructor]
MPVLRRLSIFLSLVFFTLAFALALASLLTDFWIESRHGLTRNGQQSKASYVHSGLFHGVRQIDWTLGPRLKPFSVFYEVQTNTSFFNKSQWLISLFFIALGLLWTFIGMLISLLNTVIEESRNITGPPGIHVWSTLSFTSHGIATFFFLVQFFGPIQNNVLLQDHIEAGFSSRNHIRLGFSFWLLVASCAVQLLPSTLVLVCSCTDRLIHGKQSNTKLTQAGTESTDADSTVFMY